MLGQGVVESSSGAICFPLILSACWSQYFDSSPTRFAFSKKMRNCSASGRVSYPEGGFVGVNTDVLELEGRGEPIRNGAA